jgi:hypothetical protein
MSQRAETEVAGRDRAVAIGDSDGRLLEVVIPKANRSQHRAIRRPLNTLCNHPASQIVGHGISVAAAGEKGAPPPR